MITIDSVTLNNWMRFQGIHALKLQPAFYGVTCAWSHNEDRSNMGGKTAFMEAVRFALYGAHRKRTEDEWVTEGQEEGGVTLTFRESTEETFRIIRERKHNRTKGTKSTQLSFEHHIKGKTKVSKSAEAQENIDKFVGLSLADFDSSNYLEQKKMSHFITDASGGRMGIVAGWLGLSKLETASDFCGDDLKEVLEEIAGIENNKQTCLDYSKRIYDPLGYAGELKFIPKKMKISIVEAMEQIDEAKKTEKLFIDQQAQETASVRDYADAKEYHRLVGERKALKRKLEESIGATEAKISADAQALEKLVKKLGQAETDVRSKRVLARGEFDGVCPVGGIQCPAQDQLNQASRKAGKLLENADDELQVVREQYGRAKRDLDLVRTEARDRAKDEQKLEDLRKRIAPLKAAAERVEELEEPDADVSTTEEDLRKAHDNRAEIEAKKAKLEASLRLLEEQIVIFKKADERLLVLRDKAELLRQAHHILGKGGAQRQIAMKVFGQIERGANQALAFCNIDLQAKVSWERETNELAKTCIDCGTAFPKSRKERTCALCGATRGIHFERKFQVFASNDSGGADDLAGIAVQLSAAAWLRKARSSGWTVAFLDEPLAHLDREHARSLAGHLPGLLQYFGFKQAFIVAHNTAMMAGMPAIIHIKAGPKNSAFEEVRNGSNHRRGSDAQDRRDATKRPKRKNPVRPVHASPG